MYCTIFTKMINNLIRQSVDVWWDSLVLVLLYNTCHIWDTEQHGIQNQWQISWWGVVWFAILPYIVRVRGYDKKVRKSKHKEEILSYFWLQRLGECCTHPTRHVMSSLSFYVCCVARLHKSYHAVAIFAARCMLCDAYSGYNDTMVIIGDHNNVPQSCA